MAAPTTSTSTSTTSTSTSTTTTLWFNTRDYLRLTGEAYTGATDRFYGLVNDIAAHVEDVCGVLFTVQTITEEEILGRYVAYGRSSLQFYPREFSRSYIALRLQLRHRPVNSISTVLICEKGDETSLGLENVTRRANLGIVYILTSGGKLRESVTCKVTYAAGYATKPSRVLRAIALLVREWLDSDAAGGGGLITKYRSGDYSETRFVYTKGENRVGLGTMLSRQAEILLTPWLKRLRIG